MNFEDSGSSNKQLIVANVLRALKSIPRAAFIPEELRLQADYDTPIPIGYGQTISQPSLVAYMTQCLEPKAGDRVLEIGTASGYQAAILSRLVQDVYSIEIVEPLAARAKTILKQLNISNVHIRVGDGYPGWPEEAPFDSIIVTCAPEKIPPPLIKQLKNNGSMVIPVGKQNDIQQLMLLKKKSGSVHKSSLIDVRFVPMTGISDSCNTISVFFSVQYIRT